MTDYVEGLTSSDPESLGGPCVLESEECKFTTGKESGLEEEVADTRPKVKDLCDRV